jgi:general secretion pathway protein C
MRTLLRRLVDVAVPTSVALIAFLHAQAIGSLIGATVEHAPSSIAPFAEARAATGEPGRQEARSADRLLERNPFDHVTGSLRAVAATSDAAPDDDPASAPPCDGIRAAVAVRAAEPSGSFAALDVRGKRVLRRQGIAIDDLRVVAVGTDRVWLVQDGRLCQTGVFDAARPAPPASPLASAPGSPLEKDLASKIVRSGPNEYHVDRGAVDRLLDAQAELMKTPVVPDKEGGYRLVKVKPGSPVAMLGLETGDRLVAVNGMDLSNMEHLMDAYARFRTGSVDRLTLHVVRGGKPTNIDYVVR